MEFDHIFCDFVSFALRTMKNRKHETEPFFLKLLQNGLHSEWVYR